MTSAMLPSAAAFRILWRQFRFSKSLAQKPLSRARIGTFRKSFLLRNGADYVTYPEKQLAKCRPPATPPTICSTTLSWTDRHAIVEVAVPERWVGQTVGELNIRRKYGINLLGLKKDGKTDVSVTPDTHLTKDVTILALGEYQTLKNCICSLKQIGWMAVIP